MSRLLPSMINKDHEWAQMTTKDYKVLSDLINEFLANNSIEKINFDDVSKVYKSM